MTIGKMISRLQALEKSVLADGKVDWDETEQLLDAIRPLAAKHKVRFEDYERLLIKCREDGEITPDESKTLALQLDYLCSLCANRRLTFWLAVAFAALLLVSAIAMTRGVVSSTDTSALRKPTAESVTEGP